MEQIKRDLELEQRLSDIRVVLSRLVDDLLTDKECNTKVFRKVSRAQTKVGHISLGIGNTEE
jgi:hypothetical protein